MIYCLCIYRILFVAQIKVTRRTFICATNKTVQIETRLFDMARTKRPSGQMASLPNIKIEKTHKQFFYHHTIQK
jgi:hypothetical protein